MDWRFTPYFPPLILASLISLGLARYAWQRREVAGAIPFALLMLATGEWAFAYAMGLAGTTLATRVLWAKLEFLGATWVSVCWFAFALQFNGRGDWLKPRILFLLSFIPLITLFLVFTNEAHGLIWARTELTSKSAGLDVSWGLWFWIFVVYTYSLLSVATIVLAVSVVRSPQLYRLQVAALLIGTLIPWLANAIDLAGLNPFLVSPTSMSFTLMGAIFAFGIFRFGLLDIMPMARDAVIEAMRDGILVLDARDRIVEMNPAAERLIGAHAENAIGKPAEQVLSSYRDWIERFRNVIDTTVQISVGEGDGRRELELRISPLAEKRGGVSGRVILLHELTAGELAQAALEQSQARYSELFEHVPDAIIISALDGTIASLNRAAEHLTGWTRAELIGQHFSKGMPAEAARYWNERMRRSSAGERLEPITETQILRKDGTVVPIEANVRFFRDASGNATGFQSVLRDITERKRTQAELRRQKEYFEAIFQNSPTAIVTTDLDFGIVSWNPNAEKLFGYSPSEAVGKNTDDLIVPAEMSVQAAGYNRQVTELDRVQALTRRKRKDGTLVDVELLGLPVIVSGKRVGYVVIYHDITELLRARHEAEAANQAKSAFLANMSHELRTPLNAIIGYSEMLQEEAGALGKSALGSDLERIHAAGKHLLTLINDILDLSKIEAGKMQLYLETFDIAKMIQDVTTTIQPLVEMKVNTLVVHYPREIGKMDADATKVRQILFNLLSNASKFTEKGTITLEVRRARGQPTVNSGLPIADRSQITDWITFQVADSGIGMTNEQLAKIFQPFMQADASTTRKFGGTGLGLTITKHFCAMMGGVITAASEAGKGSTFTVRLPAQVAEPKPAPAPRPIEARGEPVATAAGTILVIDDDAAMRDLLERMLNKEGFHVLTAANGAEGLRLAQKFKPHAITLDVIMPTLDGWQTLAALKADVATHDIPVIMLTVLDQHDLGFTLGAVEYLTKPVDRERLLAILHRYRRADARASVLIVEDDATTRALLARTLQSEGWRASQAENGRAALDHVAREIPTLILLDLMMPEMDGFEFVEHLRKKKEWRAIPIVVVTAKDLTPEDRLRLDGFVKRILQKGAYTREELVRQVKELLADSLRGSTP